MQDHPWTECFDFYFSAWQRAPLVVSVDLGAGDVAPLRSHPLRLQARIPMLHARPDGLRDPEEAPALFALEDALCDALSLQAPLLFVGRLVGLGEVTLIWYAPAVVHRIRQRLEKAAARAIPAALETKAREVAKAAGGAGGPAAGPDYVAVLSMTEDPDWDFYFDVLYPDVYNLQVMLNRRRLLTLQEHGDAGDRPRVLEHHARFPSGEAAEVSAQTLLREGFEVALEEEQHHADLWFSREDVLAEGRIDEVCIEILDAILPQSGHYEGWACPIVKA